MTNSTCSTWRRTILIPCYKKCNFLSWMHIRLSRGAYKINIITLFSTVNETLINEHLQINEQCLQLQILFINLVLCSTFTLIHIMCIESEKLTIFLSIFTILEIVLVIISYWKTNLTTLSNLSSYIVLAFYYLSKIEVLWFWLSCYCILF